MSEPRDTYIKELSSSMASGIDDVILRGLPPIFDIKDIRCVIIQSSGISTYFYKNEPFLEIHPMEMTTDHTQEGNKITAKFNYRYLKASPVSTI